MDERLNQDLLQGYFGIIRKMGWDGKAIALSDYFSRGYSLSAEDIQTILIDIARGLNFLHTHNFIHRNINPHNILIEQLGSHLHAKISDFSLTQKLPSAGIIKQDEILGTAYYLAPEIVSRGIYSKKNRCVCIWCNSLCIMQAY